MAKKTTRYDWALDCTDCRVIEVFTTHDERDKALIERHQDHDTDSFRQAHI